MDGNQSGYFIGSPSLSAIGMKGIARTVPWLVWVLFQKLFKAIFQTLDLDKYFLTSPSHNNVLEHLWGAIPHGNIGWHIVLPDKVELYLSKYPRSWTRYLPKFLKSFRVQPLMKTYLGSYMPYDEINLFFFVETHTWLGVFLNMPKKLYTKWLSEILSLLL
jgi:hypothetical protein